MFFQREKRHEEKMRKKADAGWNETHEPIQAGKDDLMFNGVKTVWMVQNSKLLSIQPPEQGRFYSSESYLVKYVWELEGKTRAIFYIWQGAACSGV